MSGWDAHVSGWERMDANVWPCVYSAIRLAYDGKPWPESVAVLHLRWMAGARRTGAMKANAWPTVRDLAREWGWLTPKGEPARDRVSAFLARERRVTVDGETYSVLHWQDERRHMSLDQLRGDRAMGVNRPGVRKPSDGDPTVTRREPDGDPTVATDERREVWIESDGDPTVTRREPDGDPTSCASLPRASTVPPGHPSTKEENQYENKSHPAPQGAFTNEAWTAALGRPERTECSSPDAVPPDAPDTLNPTRAPTPDAPATPAPSLAPNAAPAPSAPTTSTFGTPTTRSPDAPSLPVGTPTLATDASQPDLFAGMVPKAVAPPTVRTATPPPTPVDAATAGAPTTATLPTGTAMVTSSTATTKAPPAVPAGSTPKRRTKHNEPAPSAGQQPQPAGPEGGLPVVARTDPSGVRGPAVADASPAPERQSAAPVAVGPKKPKALKPTKHGYQAVIDAFDAEYRAAFNGDKYPWIFGGRYGDGPNVDAWRTAAGCTSEERVAEGAEKIRKAARAYFAAVKAGAAFPKGDAPTTKFFTSGLARWMQEGGGVTVAAPAGYGTYADILADLARFTGGPPPPTERDAPEPEYAEFEIISVETAQ